MNAAAVDREYAALVLEDGSKRRQRKNLVDAFMHGA